MALTIKVNTVDKTNQISLKGFKIRNRINNKVDECHFTIKIYGSKTFVPAINDTIEVISDGTTIFGGSVMRIKEKQRREILEYDIKCVDYSFKLKRRLVTERYENKTVSYIIDDLLTNYASGDGFTDNNVILNNTFDSISFNNITIPECLDKMAKSLNAYWYVDYNQDIHFFAKNTELAPFDLTDDGGNHIDDSLEIEEDLSRLRNKIKVRGGTKQSDTEKTETLISQDNAQDVFPLGYKFATKPTVEVNSVAQTVGTEYLDDDASFDCMWAFNEKYIRFTSGNIPSINDTIEVAGKILIPIVVQTPSNSSIDEFGVFEYIIKDETIKSQDEAIDRAIAELEAYANELNEGSFRTYKAGLKAGQVININSTKRNKNIDVLIQDVDTALRTPTGDLEYKITFATVKTLSIIEYLQKQLQDEDIREDEDETILNFYEFADSLSMSDSVGTPTTSSPPYKWSNDAETTPNRLVWNKGTWS